MKQIDLLLNTKWSIILCVARCFLYFIQIEIIQIVNFLLIYFFFFVFDETIIFIEPTEIF